MSKKPGATNRLVKNYWRAKQCADNILEDILIVYAVGVVVDHAHHDHISKYYDEIWRFGSERMFGTEQT